MSEVLFDVVFKGKFINGIDRSRAIVHFAKLFKLPNNKAERFFDGKPRTLKKSLSLEKANHFRAALKKAGLRVSLAKQVAANNQQDNSALTLAEPGVVIVNKPFIQPQHFNTSNFSLDEVGVQLVQFKPIEKVEFDIDELDIDEVGTQIVDEVLIEPLQIDLSALSLDEVGAIFAEKQEIQEPDLDISNLSMDEVGAVLVEKKKVEVPVINTDNIQLEE